jgi:pimeloyl-ACP methyl ester carboxylesterase
MIAKKLLLGIPLLLILVSLVVFFLGPKVAFDPVNEDYPQLDLSIENIDQYVVNKESQFDLKTDNEARIIWRDSVPSKTKYSVVYLPGFSASYFESAPLHTEFSERYGMNTYLARIYGHGIRGKDSFKNLTPEQLIASAKEAIAIGKTIGEKVIIIACSTGATYATYLAGGDDDIAALLYYSPNIDLEDQNSKLLTGPWGKQLMKKINGGLYRNHDYNPTMSKYWLVSYHIDGVIALRALIDETMNKEEFAEILQPVFLAYYYRNEEEKDMVVSVDAMKEFYESTSTDISKKRLVAIPDAGNHIIACSEVSKDVASVKLETFLFAEEILGLTPLE